MVKIPPVQEESKVRIALFTSLYRGRYLAEAFLEREGILNDQFEVVGIATDDPTNRFILPSKRIWRHFDKDITGRLVPEKAREHGVEVYTGRVKTDEFYERFDEWSPDIVLMSTFGQLINERIFSQPSRGFYNIHPSASSWPSYQGGTPLEDMIAAGETEHVLTLHEVDSGFDTGAFVARSSPIPILGTDTPADVYRRGAYATPGFVAQVLPNLARERDPARLIAIEDYKDASAAPVLLYGT